LLKLQKVELLGFKSFADRTEIAFNGDGIAAVVGPNGCGKSNISDAIHWVLGEQSPRTLRSGRMQDVIFSGTPARKATGLAEVRLTMLDPDTERDSLAPANGNGSNGTSVSSGLIHASDGLVTVARRLFASGESEYLLNDRPCRLRDIHELFLGTGLGPDSYAIIEQGRIGQILSAKPYERRSLIEEAAGITKFKAKRKLAWAKLESSKQNLARVNDILEEVTRQLNSLQRQAARARRYKDLREQMQTQLQAILVNRHRQKDEEATEVALELGLLRSSVQEQVEKIGTEEAQLRELQQLLERQHDELRQADEERGSLQLEAERLRGQIATHSQQAAYVVRRIEEARSEQTRLATRLAGLDAERIEAVRHRDELDSERDKVSAEVIGAEGRLKTLQQELENKEGRREQLREAHLEAIGESGTLRSQVAQLEQFLSLTSGQLAQAESQRSALEASQEAATGRVHQTESRLSEQRTERDRVGARRRELDEALHSAKAEEARCREELDELRTELAAQRARLTSLDEILARHAYSSETIQRLFEARDGKGSETVGRFRVAGVLADFLEVDPQYERVVEEFLREELDYVLVEDWASAQHGLRLLETEVPGRATFLLRDVPLDARRPGPPLPGTLRSLASCVHFNNGFSGDSVPMLSKLRRCFLVADTDTGRALAAEQPDLYFLTPEGVWFHGALISAGKADHQGPLALKRELRGLTRALDDHKRATEEMETALASTLRQVDEQQQELRTLAQQEQDCEKRLAMTERDLEESLAERDRAAEKLALLALEIDRLGGEADRARGKWANDTWEIAQRERRRAEIEQETASLLEAIVQLKAERESAQTLEAESRGKRAAIEEKQRLAASALARVEQATEELVRRAAELEDQCEHWSQQQVEWEDEKQRLEAQVVAAEQRSVELERRVAELESGNAEGRRQQALREQRLHQARQALEETREKRSAVEVRLALLQSEIEHLKETCRNEMQMELDELAASATASEIQVLSQEELASADDLYRQLRTKLDNLGPINMMALEEFEQCRERHQFLNQQQADLLASIRDTTQAITEIDAICGRQFAEAFGQIDEHFRRTFSQLFGGGQGMLRLLEAEDSSEAGIEIIAQPPGKKLQSVLLLSGGEKALAALALLLAIFRYRPSPFCILDEVDAPLDESNIGRFTQIVQEMSRHTQFILITHSKKTMSIAPVMYGVTMQEPGVSKIVSVRFQGAAAQTSEKGASRQFAEAVA
jgi:chromosome segregation protein